MSEPGWEAELRKTVDAWVEGGEFVRQSAYDSFLRHIDSAYRRGLTAGRSQAGYRLVQENDRLQRLLREEGPCASPSARTADGSSASAREGQIE